MSRKGFTIIELLATLIVLGLIVGLVVVTVSNTSENAKMNTEKVYIKTLKDVVDVYLNSDDEINRGGFNEYYCVIMKKNHNSSVYKYTSSIKFSDILGSTYSPMSVSDFVNPVNKGITCNLNTNVDIYRDNDQVYYYSFNLDDLECLKYNSGIVSSLPTCE